jgi:hypothetical protein
MMKILNKHLRTFGLVTYLIVLPFVISGILLYLLDSLLPWTIAPGVFYTLISLLLFSTALSIGWSADRIFGFPSEKQKNWWRVSLFTGVALFAESPVYVYMIAVGQLFWN